MPDISKLNIDPKILDNLSEQEKKVLLETLSNMSKGDSSLYQQLKYQDFDEIPVDIETFLYDKNYLGNGLIDSEGRFTVFPYWVETLKKIFPDNLTTKYNTLVLTGSIGIGKSFFAVLCMLYLLYRMLCLKDPYIYYGLQPIDKITFSFINVTIDAAKGVAWDKIQQLLQSSPWFMSHGSVSGRSELVWTPSKRIELVVGSNNNAIIGRALFCLDGDTRIFTDRGILTLRDLSGEEVRPLTYNEKTGSFEYADICTALPTAQSCEEYQIELEDETVVKCTPNHRLLLVDGVYVEAQSLTLEDRLITFESHTHTCKATNNYTCTDNCKGTVGIKSIKKLILDSPKQFYDVVESLPYHNFVIVTNSGGVVSHNCSFEDEINFASMTTDVEKIKAKQKHLISQVDARMQSRFMKGTKLPTLNIIASSKTSDQSFLDGYINTKKKNESKTTLIIDEPQWVVRNDKDSPIKFYVAVGNKFLASEVLPRDASEIVIDSYRSKGYQMMKVPIGYWEAFNDNVELALTDIAGISTTSALKYISGVRLNEIKLDGYENPFSREVLEVGTGDDLQYSQFFDTSKVSNLLKSKPLYIHLDMSKSGDRTGIAGVWIMGKRLGHGNDKQSREAYYKVAFSVAIKAPKGFEISFEKNRTFVRWLKSQGFNIKGVTMDTYQSAQIKQQLIADGFKADILSVDRLSNIDGTRTKACLPYVNFKSVIYEKRLELYRKCDLLTDEIIGLEKEPDGHIEHPEGGTQGCFTGDTKVRLVDGRSLTFFQLVEEYESGKQNYVYSVNTERECIEARPIKKVWLTLHNQPLVRVTLDNGEQIKCTPNHLFMLRNGSYIEARNLVEKTSLMPLHAGSRKQNSVRREEYRSKSHPLVNRKVAKVEWLNETSDVYDLEVDETHNFALDAGVFVHNSKDICDALCGSLYSASQHLEEYAFDYGESIDDTLKVNTFNTSREQVQNQINVAFEQELQDLLTPKSIKEQMKKDKEANDTYQYNSPAYVSQGMLIW